MGQSELSTQKYFEQAEEARAAAAAAEAATTVEEPAAAKIVQAHPWEQATAWMSTIAAGAVLVCLLAFTISYFSQPRSQKPTSPIDMFLRFGGAKSDQTFEKFLTDSIERSQRDFEKNFPQGSEFSDFKFDPEQFNFKFDSSPKR